MSGWSFDQPNYILITYHALALGPEDTYLCTDYIVATDKANSGMQYLLLNHMFK